MKTWHWIVVLTLGAGVLAADTIHLRSGRKVEGTFMGGDTRQVRMMSTEGSLQSYDINDIESIRFGGGGATIAPAAPVAVAPPRAASRPTLSGGGEVVPAGTVITVRTIDLIDSDVTRAGERFRASLDDPLQVGERTIAPRGADVSVQIVRVQQSGKLTGRDEVSMELYDITINGKKYPVATSYAEVHSGSRGARTAKVAGGTAALGAIIGAIAGGGKGAAIGAGAGAATGVGIEEVTHGQRVKVPPETRLDFTLKQALAVD